MEQPPENACRRCGTCCRRGGPALHLLDRVLVDEGRIPADQLYTLRPGEPVRDNVRGDALTTCDGDLIKIRSRPGGRVCRYFDGRNTACTIYACRPLECRILDCRDTAPIEAVYDRERLCRRDLIGTVEGLWDLVCDHERRCSAARVTALADAWRRGGHGSRGLDKELMEKVRYDLELRTLLVKENRMAEGLLDLVFGRPLTVVLKPLGVAVRCLQGRWRLLCASRPDGLSR
jgi:Fe-S-cluster containining protein